MSSALKQVIVNAVIKIAGQNPAREVEGEPTAEQARDEFIRLLIAELFPENPSVPAPKKKPGPKPKLDENGEPIKKVKSPVPSPDSLGESSPGEKKERKPRTPMSEEAKAAMVAKRKATMEAKKAAATPPASASEAPASEAPAEPAKEAAPAPEATKKEKKEKTAEEKAAIAAKRKATLEAKKAAPATPEQEAAPKPPPDAPKKAPKPSGPVNLDKFTPTQTKKLKEIMGDTVDKKGVLSYLNGLSNAAYNDKKLEDHFRDYAASLAPPAPAPEPETQQEEVDLVEVEFDGETYYVNPETKRVYTMDETGTHPVGYVGMAKFEAMEMPTEDGEDVDEDEE